MTADGARETSRGPVRRPSLRWAAFACGALLPLAAQAVPMTLSCEEPLVDTKMQSAGTANHMIVIEPDPPASLTLRGPWGENRLPAQMQKSAYGGAPNAMSVRASGPAMTPMPEKADVDACLSDARMKRPELFEGGEVNASLAQGCRLRARSTSAPVPVQLSVVMTMLDPPNVDSFFVERRYAGDEQKAADIYGTRSFPEWKCRVGEP